MAKLTNAGLAESRRPRCFVSCRAAAGIEWQWIILLALIFTMFSCEAAFVVSPLKTLSSLRAVSSFATTGTTTTTTTSVRPPTFSFSPECVTMALSSSSESNTDQNSRVELTIDMPPSGSGLQAVLQVEPLLSSSSSEMVQVRYTLPFDLNVAPTKDGKYVVCTKDGPGGEREGDILRYTSQWSLGLPRGDGILATASALAGGVSWQCSLFDVAKAQQWQEVVEALTSNVPSRTDQVVLVFERATGES